MSKLEKILSNTKSENSSEQEKLDQLKAQVLHAFANSEGDHTQFVEHCNKADLYYNCQLPKSTLLGGDTFAVGGKEFVYPVFYNAVKAATPQQLDAFLSNDDLAVEIRSRGFRQDPKMEKLATYNINKKFIREGNGKPFLRGCINSAFVHGTAPAILFETKKTYHDTTDTIKEWTEYSEFMMGIAEGWTIDRKDNSFGDGSDGSYNGFHWKEETEIDPATGKEADHATIYVKGKIPLIKIEKKIDYQEIEPQDFYFDSTYGDAIDKLRYAARRIRTTVGDAELMGYDPDKLVNAPDDAERDERLPNLYFSPALYDNPAATGSLNTQMSVDPKERKISLIEHQIYSSIMHPDNETRIYHVITAGDEILDWYEIKRMTFVIGKVDRVQGQFLGAGIFPLAKQFQDALSLSHRLHEHVALLTTYPQYQAIKGMYDRQSLLNNRPGAVIEVSQQGAVERFQPMPLTDTYLSAITNLKECAVETLTQPTDITNGDGGMSQVATATAYLNIFQQAQKEMMTTEALADSLFKPFFTLYYEMMRDAGIEFEDPDGKPIDASMLPSVFELVVDPQTTNDQFAQHMQVKDAVMLSQMMASFNSSFFTDQNKYEVLKRICDDFDLPMSMITDPSQNQDPHAAAEQAEQMAIQSEAMKTELETKKAEMRKTAAETFLIEQKAEELIRNGQAERMVKHTDSLGKIQKIQADAQNHATANQVRAQEVAVKEKAVNYEAILGAAKHTTDITAPNINGVR